MCSVINNEGDVKTSASTSMKVRRRLFQEEEGKKTYHLRKYEHSVKEESTSVIQEDEMVTSTKSIINQILIITTFEDSSGMQLLSDQATCTINKLNVLHCLPENAFRQCDQARYQLIFTDIDLSQNSETLRLIISIRKFSQLNNTTPIIAVHQSQHKNVDDLTHYGVSGVFRGELDLEQIKKIILQYKHVFADSRNQPDLVETKSSCSISISPTKSPHPMCDSTCEPAVIVLDKNNYPDEDHNVPPSSKDEFNTNSFSSNNIKEVTGKSPSTVVSPIEVKGISIYSKNVKNCVEVSPIIRTAAQRQKHIYSKGGFSASSHQVQPFSLIPRRYPCSPGSSLMNGSTELPYMISGVPGSSDMKITVIPDDAAKHSTKERVRRERIKACCEQLRNLLPKPLDCVRKIDMATVLELTVMYLKIFQNHTSSLIQDQCSQVFQTHFQQLSGKRNLPDEEKDVTMKLKRKLQKRDIHEKSFSSPRRGMLFQPLANTFSPHCRSVASTSFLPQESVIPTTHPQQSGLYASSMSMMQSRSFVPSYQGMDYFNMPLPNTYENVPHVNQLQQLPRGISSTKDSLLLDTQMSIANEYWQPQHFPFYNHH